MDFAGISEENRVKTFNEVVSSLKESDHVSLSIKFFGIRREAEREVGVDQVEAALLNQEKLNLRRKRKGTQVAVATLNQAGALQSKTKTIKLSLDRRERLTEARVRKNTTD